MFAAEQVVLSEQLSGVGGQVRAVVPQGSAPATAPRWPGILGSKNIAITFKQQYTK